MARPLAAMSVAWSSPPSVGIQELDGLARHVHHRENDRAEVRFQSAVAGGDLELRVAPKRSRNTCAARHSPRSRAPISTRSGHQQTQRAAGGMSMPWRRKAADHRIDGFGVDHPGVEQVRPADETGNESVGRLILDFVR
jgi:hypothetical protein